MRCAHCDGDTRVVETRPAEDGAAVRRRRECSRCERRFTTFERVEGGRLYVRKRDGTREPFDRAKLRDGLLRAAHKRPVDPTDAQRLVDRIGAAIARAGGELPAQRVGDMALEGLEELDRIAYLQFAAVYKGFEDPDEFGAELRRLGVEPQTASSGAGGSVRAAGEHA
jgi:transcriptional repressor NrdR